MEEELWTLSELTLTKFGLGCMLAMAVGLICCLIVLVRKRMGYGVWIRLCVCVIPLSLLVARLGWVMLDLIMVPLEGMFDLDTGRDLSEALYFWHGGYSLIGAVIGAWIGACLAEKWTRSGKGVLQDSLALGIPAAIVVERLMERGTSLGLGRVVTAEWLLNTGIYPEADGDPVHPVYLYEAAVALCLFVIMLVLSLKKDRSPAGSRLRLFLFLYGLTQVLMESLRADGHMVEHFVHFQQVYALILSCALMLRWTVMAARKPGRHPALTIGWIITLVCIGAAVLAEFGVDRWGKPMLAYGLMIVCLAAIGVIGFEFRHMADR